MRFGVARIKGLKGVKIDNVDDSIDSRWKEEKKKTTHRRQGAMCAVQEGMGILQGRNGISCAALSSSYMPSINVADGRKSARIEVRSVSVKFTYVDIDLNGDC